MKNNITKAVFLLAVGVLFLSGSAMAAGSPQSRLVTMETYGADANYVQPETVMVPVSSQTTGLLFSWAMFNRFLEAVSQTAVVASLLFLLYIIAMLVHEHYKKPNVRMHSHAAHAMMKRHH